MTLKIRGQSEKTERMTAQKNKGGILAVGTYLQRGSGPPPPHGGYGPKAIAHRERQGRGVKGRAES